MKIQVTDVRSRAAWALALTAALLLFAAVPALAGAGKGEEKKSSHSTSSEEEESTQEESTQEESTEEESSQEASSHDENSSDAKNECSDSHHSDTGHGANQGGPYDNTCEPEHEPGNGSEQGQATGQPCAGCVGNADDKNPGFNSGKGQMPNGSDHNAGYECDRNQGVGQENPAHTGCANIPSDSDEELDCTGDMDESNNHLCKPVLPPGKTVTPPVIGGDTDAVAPDVAKKRVFGGPGTVRSVEPARAPGAPEEVGSTLPVTGAAPLGVLLALAMGLIAGGSSLLTMNRRL